MYSPCLLISRVPKVYLIASSHRLREVPAEAHKAVNTGKQSMSKHLLLQSKHEQASTRRQHETSHLPSRAVTNRLSGVLFTHDDTAHLERFKWFSYRLSIKVVNMAYHQAWHSTQTWQEVEHKLNCLCLSI